ncbi:MAG: BatD family protein [Methanothrix sp.]
MFLAIASTTQAVVWNEGISGELHWGKALLLDNYTTKLADFSIENSETTKVLVDLQKNNLTIASRALQAGEWFSLNDSIKVTIEQIVRGDIQDDPSAKIRMQLPASAEISLILTGERYIFQGGDEMRMQLQIENKGIVDAENLRITLDSIPPLVNARYSIPAVEAGRVWDKKKNTREIENIKINPKAPYFPEPTDLKLRAHAEYTDPEGRAYESWGGAVFRISGPLQLHKRVEEIQDFQKSYYVINSLRNSGNRTLAITLSDSTGSGFHTNSSLSWKLYLSPGEAKTESYRIEAKRPGRAQVLPDGEARYSWDNRSYTVHSERPVVDVFGPLIEVERTVSPTELEPGREATVSIQLANTGNKNAVVSLQELVPEGTELVSESANESLMLSPNETYSKEYMLRCTKPGIIRLPSTEISYRDVRGNEYHTSARALEIEVQAEKETNQTAPALNEVDELNGTGKADVEAEAKSEEYISFLLLLIVLLLSTAFSRYP